MDITISVECVDTCLKIVPEIADLGRLLAAALPEKYRLRALYHHRPFWCQRGSGKDFDRIDNPVVSLASCGLSEKNSIGDHAGGFFELLHLNGAYRKDDGIRILVGGHGTSEETAIADAVFKTLQKLLTISLDKVHLPLQAFPGGADAITHIRAAASSANLKLFEKLRDEGLFSFTEEMTPLLQLDLLSLAPRWRQASRNSRKLARFDDSSETVDEKEHMFLENRNVRTKVSAIESVIAKPCPKDGNVIAKPCPHRCEERGTEWEEPDCDGMCQGELGHTNPTTHFCKPCNPWWGLNGEDDRRERVKDCLLYTSPSPRDNKASRMPSSA